MKQSGLAGALCVALALACASAAWAQSPAVKTTYVRLGSGVPGVFYQPAEPGAKAGITVFVMHPAGDYLQHSSCTELSKRGYQVLCANATTNKAGNQTDQDIEQLLLEAKLGMNWLRSNPAVRKVILFGHSGGGVMLSAYQAVAENGVGFCQGPEKIVKCSDRLAGLPPADGIILMDVNLGTAVMSLFSLDPAVLDNTTGMKVDPALDPWNPANGFSASGAMYTEEFTRRYLRAIARRENALVKLAQERLQKIEAGQGLYRDDEPFVIAGASNGINNNKLFSQDVRFLGHTGKPFPLLHKDGSLTHEVVRTIRFPENLAPTTPVMATGTLRTTVRRFLSTYAIRVSENLAVDGSSISGVDWESSLTSPIANVRKITVPMLTMGMQAHVEFMNSAFMHDHSASRDKSVVMVEGANHGFDTCRKCETTPGQYGDTMKTTYDYLAAWLGKPGRF
jgi:hypothetical protein